MSAGLSNIEESERRLGYQLRKIGYTLCAKAGASLVGAVKIRSEI